MARVDIHGPCELQVWAVTQGQVSVWVPHWFQGHINLSALHWHTGPLFLLGLGCCQKLYLNLWPVETCWFVLVFMALVTTKDSEDRSSELAPPLNNSRTSPGKQRRADSVSRVQVSQSRRNESGRAIYLSPSCVGEGKMTPFLTAGGRSCPTNGRVGPSPQWQLQHSGEWTLHVTWAAQYRWPCWQAQMIWTHNHAWEILFDPSAVTGWSGWGRNALPHLLLQTSYGIWKSWPWPCLSLTAAHGRAE